MSDLVSSSVAIVVLLITSPESPSKTCFLQKTIAPDHIKISRSMCNPSCALFSVNCLL